MPTRKTLYWLATIVSLYAIAWNVGSGWLNILAALIAGAPLGSLALSRINTTGVQLRQQITGSASQGDGIAAGLSIENGSRLPHFFLRLEGSFGGGSTSLLLPWLKGGGSVLAQPWFADLVRGEYPGGEYTLSSSAPFGLFRSRRRRQAACPLVVYPRWHKLINDWDTGHKNAGYVVSSTIATRQSTSDYLGVREYRPEDVPRSIHWRTTARAGRLSVIDYARQAAVTPVILIDTFAGSHAGAGAEGTFETAVCIAASLVQRELLHNRRFGLGSSPADAAAAGLGQDHDQAMLRLARIQPDSDRPMDLQEETLPWPTVMPVLILTTCRRYAALPDSEFLHNFPQAVVIMLDPRGFDPKTETKQQFMEDDGIRLLQLAVESGGGGFLLIRSPNEVRECLTGL
ncbi:MAG: DUF58 domain-containing protein [Thermoleophilia bacterium]